MRSQSADRSHRRRARAFGVGLLAALALVTAAQTPRPERRGIERLRVILTTDLHGQLTPYVDLRGARFGGASGVAAVIEDARRECRRPVCESVLLDAGDLLGGTPESDLEFGRPALELANLLRYDAAAVGNADFNWGLDTLAARARGARFPLLAANVHRADGAPLPWLRGDTIVRRGGVEVGVIGVVTMLTPATSTPGSTAELVFADPAATIDSLVPGLRARGADVIVVLAHAGVRCDRGGGDETCVGEARGILERLAQPVDVFVAGHTHQPVAIRVGTTPLVQPWSNARSVAVVDLAVDSAGRPTRAASVDLRTVHDTTLRGARVAAVDRLVRRAERRTGAFMARRVATAGDSLLRAGAQFPLGNLVADAHRAAGRADVAVINTRGVHGDVPKGAITNRTVYDLQPFGNILYRYTLPGAALRAYLERVVADSAIDRHLSGATVVYDPARPAGARVLQVRLADGRALDDSATYSFVMNDYVRNSPKEAELALSAIEVEPVGMNDREALLRHLPMLPQPVRAPAEPRIRPSGAPPAAVTPAGGSNSR